MPTTTAFSHVTLTVTDLEASVAWYTKALGMKRLRDMSGPSWKRVLMLGDQGVIVGLQSHESTPQDARFDETRPGLDHLSFACAGRAEVQAWVAHLDEVGIEHGAIGGDPAAVVTCHDPDGIAIEFFAPPAS